MSFLQILLIPLAVVGVILMIVIAIGNRPAPGPLASGPKPWQPPGQRLVQIGYVLLSLAAAATVVLRLLPRR